MFFRYLRYVVKHKWFVYHAGRRTKAPMRNLLIHDWSKFLPSEYRAYATYFYGEKKDAYIERRTVWHLDRGAYNKATAADLAEEEWEGIVTKREDAFNVAWLKHQHRNPHHWQHWLLAEDNPARRMHVPQTSDAPRHTALEMPEQYVREMVADWCGAGRAITGKWDIMEWYDKNKDNIILHAQTRRRVEYLLRDLHRGKPL